MSLIEFSLKRCVTVWMCAVALVVFGVVAFQRLPINLLPDISYPSLTVETRFPGAAPGEVESLVSRPVEEAVGVVAGVQRLISVSRPGLSQVTVCPLVSPTTPFGRRRTLKTSPPRSSPAPFPFP